MSDRFEVTAGERGIVRLFAVDLPPDEIAQFDPAAALGVPELESSHVELFPVDDLKGLGLSGYLTEGLGVAPGEVAGDAARLDSLTGHVLVVLSGAFGGKPATLTPRAPLRWIGTYTEEHAPVKFEELPSAAATGSVAAGAGKPASQGAILGRVAMIALLVIFALTALMIWVAS